MKRPFALIMAALIMPLLFMSCSKDDDNLTDTIGSNGSSYTNDIPANFQVIALNISEETEDADVLLLCDDGSYILCDANNGNGYGVIYFNSSVSNEISEGIAIYLDGNGTPIMASLKDGHLLFNNITDNSFDFAYIDKNGNTSYYWDIPFPYSTNASQPATRAWYDPWINSWKDIGSTVRHWSWDDHQKRAIVPFLCKMGSFTITAVGIVSRNPFEIASGINTLFDEVNKSGDFTKAAWLEYLSNTVDFANFVESSTKGGWSEIVKNGKVSFSPKGFGLNILAKALNDYGESELANLSNYSTIFDNVKYKITLSTYLLECSMDESTYTVNVSTIAEWDIDDSNVDKKWCSVSKENGRIVVRVKGNDETEDRVCFAKIVASEYDTHDIPPAKLTIKQTGVLFQLAPEIVFTQEGGETGVNVYTSKNIVSWRVTSQPWWCRAENRNGETLFVSVQKDEHLLEDREGIITVTAQLTNGISIDRTVVVRQIVTTWDGTSWHFQGTGSAWGESSTGSFTLSIQDASAGKFSSDNAWNSMELLDNGDLKLKLYRSVYEGSYINLEMTITRTSQTTARGILTGGQSAEGDYTNWSGVYNGTLIGSTKAEKCLYNHTKR